MARPKKEGLSYFPMDVDFFNDEKIEAISSEFGAVGEAVVLRLLCAIYRNGYYLELTDLMKMKIVKSVGCSLEVVDSIIERSLRWKIFHEDTYREHGILTSHGIQTRYFEAIKRRKSQNVNVRYNLLEDGFMYTETPLSGINVDNNPPSEGINDDNNPQSKVKKSKVKKSKGEETPLPPPPPPLPEVKIVDDYDQFLAEITADNNALNYEPFCMSNGISVAVFKAYAKQVVDEWKCCNRPPSSDYDARKHLLNTIRIIIQKNRRNASKQSPRADRRCDLEVNATAEDYASTF